MCWTLGCCFFSDIGWECVFGCGWECIFLNFSLCLLLGRFLALFFSYLTVIESPLSLLLFRFVEVSIASGCSTGEMLLFLFFFFF